MTLTRLLVLTIGEAGRFFGVEDRTISGLIKAREIPTLPMRHNGKAKGLNLSAMRMIADSLDRPRPDLDDIERFINSAA